MTDIEPLPQPPTIEESDTKTNEPEQLSDTQKLQLADRANEIYRNQLKYMQDHLASLRSLMQDKENIIENLMLRYDMGNIEQDPSASNTMLSAEQIDEKEDENLRHKAEALAQRSILENFELREMVNETRDENHHLRNEIYALQDKINIQVLQIKKLEKEASLNTKPIRKIGVDMSMNPIYGFDDEHTDEIKASVPDSECSSAPCAELFDAYSNDNSDSEDDEELDTLNNAKADETTFSISKYFDFAFVSTMYTLMAMAYEYCTTYIVELWQGQKGYSLHFVGIGRPSTIEPSDIVLFEHINTQNTLMTIETHLSSTHCIQDLKDIIKEVYGIPGHKDVLIMLAHDFITKNTLTLGEVGICNNSLLTLAICEESRCVVGPEPIAERIVGDDFCEPVGSVNELFADSDSDSDSSEYSVVYSDSESENESDIESSSVDNGNVISSLFGMYEDESDDESDFVISPQLFLPNEFVCVENGNAAKEKEVWPQLGFDVITQCESMVHKMPKCGHTMNSESLYHYAMSCFADPTCTTLKCPHSIDEDNTLCNTEWDYLSIIDILRYKEEETNSDEKKVEESEIDWTNYGKLELLASRNIVQSELDSQKCPNCHTLYFKNYNPNKTPIDEIKSIEDIENEFRFECIFCPNTTIETTERVKIPSKTESNSNGPHFEDDIIEDIDGAAVNAMFAQNDDEDSDIESDAEDEDEEFRSVRLIQHMFDDDEPEYEEVVTSKFVNTFCFCCGKNWSVGHVCDSSFKSDLVHILQQAEKKKIGPVDGVPSIRACPECSQLITHTEACKHMQCGRCKKDFCFVCLKMKVDGKWQCGSYDSKCAVHAVQKEDALPNTIIIEKKSFNLY